VIHTTLVGLERATFRSLVDFWSNALPVVPPSQPNTATSGFIRSNYCYQIWQDDQTRSGEKFQGAIPPSAKYGGP